MLKLILEQDPQNIFFRCVESSNETIMISDPEGQLVYVNPAWSKIYGFTREEAQGKTPRILHSGHHPREFYQGMWKDIADPHIGFWKGEIVNRAKDGRLVPVLLSITPFRSPEGAVVGHMGVALDITARKELEAKVVHQDRLASIGILASGLAHEVGNPLSVIRGRAEFLEMSTKETSIREGLAVIISQIDRISKLIRSLLRVSRVKSGEARLVPLQVGEVVDEVFSLIGQKLRADSIEVFRDYPVGFEVLADFELLEQVLLNLAINSIHAIHEAAQMGREGPHSIRIAASQRKDYIAVEITDTGVGISPENMSKLFRPFFTTKQVGEGTGLGLAIVAQLLREMDGEITVSSRVGVGTTFTLLLKAPVRSP